MWNIAKDEDTRKAEPRRSICNEDSKIFTGDNPQPTTGPSIASFTCSRAESGTSQQGTHRGPGGTFTRAPRISLKIPGFKQITFLIDTGSDIPLIHEAYLENKNLPRVDLIVIFGVTTHSIKIKYGVIEMFGKKHIFHMLDNNSPVKHQEILGIDFLTKNNFTFSNKSLTLNEKEFKRCDKPHHNDTKEKDVLVVFKNDTGAITRIPINQFYRNICIQKSKALKIFTMCEFIQSQKKT